MAATFIVHTSRNTQLRVTLLAVWQSRHDCHTVLPALCVTFPVVLTECIQVVSGPCLPATFLSNCGLLVNETASGVWLRLNGEAAGEVMSADRRLLSCVPDGDAVAPAALRPDPAVKGTRFGADAYLPTTSPCNEYDPVDLHVQRCVELFWSSFVTHSHLLGLQPCMALLTAEAFGNNQRLNAQGVLNSFLCELSQHPDANREAYACMVCYSN